MALFDINKYIEEQGSEEPVSSIMRPNTQAEEPDDMTDFYKRFSKSIYDAFPDKEKFRETFAKQRKTGINWDEVRRYTREADMQDAIQSSIEQAMGIVPQQEEEPEQPQGVTLVDVTDTDEGRLSNEAPLQELMSDITEEKIAREELPAAETGKGLMSSPRPKLRPEGLGKKSESNKDFEKKLEDRIAELEGFRAEPYKPVDTEEHFTIGYGHYGPDVKKGTVLTEEEARELLRKDIKKRMPKIKKAIKNYDSLSDELKIEIAQSWFRGGISGSPKTIKLINQGKFDEAAVEFLDNDEYRTTKLSGVKTRMESLAKALENE